VREFVSVPPVLKVWLVICAIALAVLLGSSPLLDADEGRNAEVGREMAETNDYVMPRYNGLPYLDKPVVYFAAEAAVMEVLGPTELAARLPAYLFTIATAAVLFWFARRLWGGEAPWIAVIVFLSMPLTVAFARTVIFDSALTFFVVVALTTFYFAIEERRRRWSLWAWPAMGLAMITKGPVTFILVLFVAIPYALKRRALRVVFPIEGLLLFGAIIGPWVYGVSQVVPEFLRYVLVTETAERMATKALQRTGPPWYFIPYLVGGALPWALVALFSWRRVLQASRPASDADREGHTGRNAILYLLLWIAIPFVFFSLSQSKRPQYILPLMPAIALLVARIWHEARTRVAAATLAVLGLILVAAPLYLHRAKMKPEIAGVAGETAIALGIAFAFGGFLAWFVRRRDFVLVALSLPIVALPILADPLLRGIAERRSAKGFVERLVPHLGPQTEVVGVEAFTGSLAFYLRRPVTVVSEDASELTSNYLVRRYEKFSTNPSSTLKPLAYFDTSLAECCTPRVYVVRNNDRKRRALLEARGWRLIAGSAHHVAYARIPAG
jgi:4-amino-4-deoxy-L-arabinose transferase-like glycosyltransferase